MEVTAYICPEEMSAIKVVPPISPNVTTLEEQEDKLILETKIQPLVEIPGCTSLKSHLQTKIIEEWNNVYCNLEPDLGWFQTCKYRDTFGFCKIPGDKIKIYFFNPDHCHWIGTILWYQGARNRYFPSSVIADVSVINSGECPEDKENVFPGGYYTDITLSKASANIPVPGENLLATWYFYDGQNTFKASAGITRWCTPCLTGGRITEIVSQYDELDLRYKVNIGGQIRTCCPSDFIRYAIDDWVFVRHGSYCADLSRTTPWSSDWCEDDGNYILPLKIENV